MKTETHLLMASMRRKYPSFLNSHQKATSQLPEARRQRISIKQNFFKVVNNYNEMGTQRHIHRHAVKNEMQNNV
jgi:hypothetical protein